MRVGTSFKLIDFDAALSIGAPRSAGKLSTAYAPPEALYGRLFELVGNSEERSVGASADAWSFSATLYRALQYSTLVRVVADDAAGDSELRTISEVRCHKGFPSSFCS